MMDSAPSPLTWPIIGHTHHVDRLRRIVRYRQYPFSILMTGAPRVGRKALATQFAAAAICPAGHEQIACGECQTCSRIAAGTHPDVEFWSVERQERESGSSKSAALSIETVRRIAATTSLRPVEGAHRFIIVDDADTLGDTAQQALLKTLEDLPSFATIVLIASSAGAMLETVRSRSMELALQLIPSAVIAASLGGPDAVEIGALAGGRPGWAVQAQNEPEWRAAQIESLNALESWLRMSKTERLVEAYIRGDEFARNRRQTVADLDQLQLIQRDVILTASDLPQFVFNATLATRLVQRLGGGLPEWRRALVATRQCVQDLTGNVRPRLAMQAMVNQWPTLS
jgi:DNA polymerase III subunit delta'